VEEGDVICAVAVLRPVGSKPASPHTQCTQTYARMHGEDKRYECILVPKALCAASTVSAFAVAQLDFPAQGPVGAQQTRDYALGCDEDTHTHNTQVVALGWQAALTRSARCLAVAPALLPWQPLGARAQGCTPRTAWHTGRRGIRGVHHSLAGA
jgi:hypothetical protein